MWTNGLYFEDKVSVILYRKHYRWQWCLKTISLMASGCWYWDFLFLCICSETCYGLLTCIFVFEGRVGNNLQKKTHSAPVMSECIVNTSPMYMFYFTRVIVLILGLAFSLLRHFWPHFFFFLFCSFSCQPNTVKRETISIYINCLYKNICSCVVFFSITKLSMKSEHFL